MGTIIKDFFYQNEDQNEFDQVINEQIWETVSGRNIISDLYTVEELFTEITAGIIDYIDVHKAYVEMSKRANMDDTDVETIKDEINTLDGIILKLSEANRINEGAYSGLLNIFKRDRANRASIINVHKSNKSDFDISYAKLQRLVTIKSQRLISLFEKLNEKYKELSKNDQIVGMVDNRMAPLKRQLTSKIISPGTVDYLVNEYNIAFEEELDYLYLIFESVPMISAENLNYNDVSNLEDILMKAKNIKEVLTIKKELLAKMYYKTMNLIAYDKKDNLDYISQEVCQMDSATEYIEHMLQPDTNTRISSDDLAGMNSQNISDEYIKELNRRLNNVYLSHISPIRVVK